MCVCVCVCVCRVMCWYVDAVYRYYNYMYQIFRKAEPSLLFSEGCDFFPAVYLLGREKKKKKKKK